MIKIDARKLKSMSVHPDEVCALELNPGETITCKGKSYTWDKPVALMVDRLHCHNGVYRTTMIRQVLELLHDEWGQDYADPAPKARAWAKKAGARRVTVPGGIPPLTIEGTIAVPDFSMSGTSWFIVPEDKVPVFDLTVHYLGALNDDESD